MRRGGDQSSSSSSSGGGERSEMVMKPAWLEGLMGESTFFAACGVHENQRKNEKNIFCLDCCQSFCPHCLPSHRNHPLLQVRRYVYHNVVRLDDLEKLIDCSYIQPYTINSAKVIFLNQRAQSRSCKGSSNICFNCDRILQDPFHFCSLSCKVDHMVYQGRIYQASYTGLTDQISPLSIRGTSDGRFDLLDDDNGQITPNSILEDPLQFIGSSCSNTTVGSSGISRDPERKTKKKGSTGFLPGIVLSLTSRRKGAPHRSPLS